MSAILVIVAFLATLAAAQDPKGIVRRYEEDGLVGQEVLLPCEVDKASCGDFHSIKWYKGNVRVFIFSEMANVKRPEGPLLDRTTFLYNTNGTDSKLSIYPLRTEDQGMYKCEITYIEVREACSVVQFVNLTTYAIPTYVRMTVDDGTPVENGTKLGPLDEGTTLELSCTSGGGKPVAKVTWWKDEVNIGGDYHTVMDEDGSGTGSNTIRVPLTREDLGARYVCQAENVAMEQPYYTWAEVDVNVAPLEVDIDTDASDLREGSDVTLVCLVTGSRPAAAVKWYNGTTLVFNAVTEVNVQEDYSQAESEDGTWQTLSRLSFVATRYENQDFTCEASNVVLGGIISSTHTLDVMYVPAVRVVPENITVNESMDILIFCQYDANPIELISVDWYLNGRHVDVEGNPDKYGNGNVEHPSLLVKNSTDADMGEYTCRVANSVGASAEANSAYVSVQFRPEVQVLMEPSEPVSEEERLNVTLVCDAIKANPEYLTRVRWYLDGDLLKELPECDGNATFYGYDSELCNIDPGRLLLENVFRDFHGNYSCEGMNEAGWGARSQEAELVVLYPPGQAFVNYLPPMVVKGRPVELTCSMEDPGRPAATTFKWYRGAHLVPDVTGATWTINPASLETEDNFTCVPVNSQGEGMNTSVQIDVLAAPTFIERLPPYHGALMNADEVSLSCRVECSPLCDINWFKDDYPLDNSTHYVVKTSTLPSDPASGDLESVVSVLTWRIEKWPDSMLDREIDNANYTCTSSANRAGPHVTSTTSFRVEYPPEGISVSRDVVEVVEGEEAPKVECSASSFPEATYVWMHGAETVSTGQVLHLNFGMTREKGGEYACIAENRHGKQTVVTTFDVMFRPECKIDRQDFGDGDEAFILLICRATANPEDVSFRWRTGNETLVRNVVSEDLESRLRLPASAASLGTYYCYVNNSVGESIPCEIDVTGVAGIFKKLGDDNIIIISAVVVAAIVLVLIICVVIIIICRRQRQAGKYTGTADLQERENPAGTLGRGDPHHTNTTSTTSSNMCANVKPVHKWPLRPGVHVHVNSLTSLTDDTKPLHNNNTIGSTTIVPPPPTTVPPNPPPPSHQPPPPPHHQQQNHGDSNNQHLHHYPQQHSHHHQHLLQQHLSGEGGNVFGGGGGGGGGGGSLSGSSAGSTTSSTTSSFRRHRSHHHPPPPPPHRSKHSLQHQQSLQPHQQYPDDPKRPLGLRQNSSSNTLSRLTSTDLVKDDITQQHTHKGHPPPDPREISKGRRSVSEVNDGDLYDREVTKAPSISDMADGTSTGRKRKRPGQADPEKTPATSSKAPAPLSSGAPIDPTAPHNPSHHSHPGNGHPNAPAADEEPTQYENLAFHGLQPPPNKPFLSNLGGEMEYADVDYQTYTYGPIPYKAASIQKAEDKKAERDAETMGVPVRPPRKK